MDCEICGRQFRFPSSLAQHQQKHAQQKALRKEADKLLKKAEKKQAKLDAAALNAPQYALLGDEPIGEQPKRKWRLPDLKAEFPKIDVESLFTAGGDPVGIAREAYLAANSLAVKLSHFYKRLEKAKGNATWLECGHTNGVLRIAQKFRKKPRVFGGGYGTTEPGYTDSEESADED